MLGFYIFTFSNSGKTLSNKRYYEIDKNTNTVVGAKEKITFSRFLLDNQSQDCIESRVYAKGYKNNSTLLKDYIIYVLCTEQDEAIARQIGAKILKQQKKEKFYKTYSDEEVDTLITNLSNGKDTTLEEIKTEVLDIMQRCQDILKVIETFG